MPEGETERERRRRRPKHVRVISALGTRDTRLVGLFRLASSVSIALSLLALGLVYQGDGAGLAYLGVGLAVLAGIFAYAEIAYGGRAARAEEKRLRHSLLIRQFSGRPGNDSSAGEGESARIIQMMTDNVERLTEYRQVYFGATLAAIATPFVVLLAVGVLIDPVVGFGVLVTVPLIPLLIGGFMRFFRATSAESRTQRSKLAGKYLDAIRNLVVIRLMGAGPRIEHELSVQGEQNRGAIMRLLAGNQIVIIVMDGLFGLVLICLTAGLTIGRAEHMTPAQILTVMLLTVLLLEPLQQVAGFFYIGMGGMAAQRALRGFMTSDPEPTVPDAGPQLAVIPVRVQVDPTLGIEMSGVNFDYGRGPVLRDLNLSVPAGARVAIMGRSGVGKSTLMGLLRGSLAPQSGRIAISGVTLDPANAPATRALSATVAQSTWMFTATIGQNLRMAREDATDTQIWDALRAANIEDEVARMPDGLDTYLGESAALISGGQAQRISLARALLSGRGVLLLDEPTSQIDLHSEARIIEAIAALPRNLTMVIVTHRRSLLELADCAYTFVDGQLQAMELVHG